jgi:alpha-mannosidase
MINVHIIFNAHIDPIWLWPWPAGLDEAIATCRSACDRLDAHPDLIFMRGEAWIYKQIEEIEPVLFERIKEHVRTGQWEIVGGWWLQPDCNLPSGFGMEKQIALGKEYFESRFGVFPKTAYNVDTFGHAATLPAMMHQVGQSQYVMMRPQEHEMELPARLFRWRGYEHGPEIVTFRIGGSYNAAVINQEHIEKSMKHLPAGVQHTMCFVGVGDHGGGPTEGQIAWVREHMDAIPGCRLLFSSVSRFFDAIAPQTQDLALVVGELQQHAIGCYTVHRSVKTGVRRAEHRLHQAELAGGPDPGGLLKQGWEYTCFHQFHDTIGGTCLPSAYEAVDDHLGFAHAAADDALVYGLRRRMRTLPDSERQRMVLWNPSDGPFDGYVEFEPWLGWKSWQSAWRLIGADGSVIPYQQIASEAVSNGLTRLLFPIKMAAGELRAIEIDEGTDSTEKPSSTDNVEITAFGTHHPLTKLLRLDLIDDPSDTWSHGIDRYAESGEVVVWSSAKPVEAGPCMWSWQQTAAIGDSRIKAEWRVYRGQPSVSLKLEVDWREKHKLLKLAAAGGFGDQRVDGIMGGKVQRPNDGRELPLRDWTYLPGTILKEGLAGIVSPDVFAADATSERVRLTLLRSAIMAHHEPHSGGSPNAVVSDRGVHHFRFEFWPATDGDLVQTLDRRSLQLQRPPLGADLTRGMKAQRQS